MADTASSRQRGNSPSQAVKSLVLLLTTGLLLSWAYIAFIQPPPPKVCGTPSGLPVTAPRIVLQDGRHLAYKERGVPKEKAKHKVIVLHGVGGSRHNMLPVSEELLEELSVYMVSYDRAGYGQSDPHPKRSVKSEAYDIQDLADKLELGPKFYLASISIGGYSAWASLKYLPHRLAGVVMFAPVTNFWWAGIPPAEAYEAFNTQATGDKLALLVSHYTPWFLYFWMTQKWFPTSSIMGGLEKYCNEMDRDAMKQMMEKMDPAVRKEATQQGIFESMIKDKLIMFGNWEFDPADVEDPFPSKNGSVHIWHGAEDYLVPVVLQRYVHRRLPWVHYHELAGVGHMIHYVEGLSEKALRILIHD